MNVGNLRNTVKKRIAAQEDPVIILLSLASHTRGYLEYLSKKIPDNTMKGPFHDSAEVVVQTLQTLLEEVLSVFPKAQGQAPPKGVHGGLAAVVDTRQHLSQADMHKLSASTWFLGVWSVSGCKR